MFFNTPATLMERVQDAEILYVFEGAHYSQDAFEELAQHGEKFLPCEKTEKDGKAELRYSTGKFRSFAGLMSRINPKSFISIITELMDTIVYVKNHPLLHIENLEVSFERVFVDMGTLKTRFIYLPLKFSASSGAGKEMEREIASQIAVTVRRNKNINSDSTDTILELLPQADGFERLLSLFTETREQNVARPHADTVPLLERLTIKKDLTHRTDAHQNSWASSAILTTGNLGTFRPKLMLVTVNSSRQMSILIDKPRFVIGKSCENTDAVVDFNHFISKEHCRFCYENGGYYLEDLGSTNRTFVNGESAAPFTKVPVKEGDTIRMANTEFMLKIF